VPLPCLAIYLPSFTASSLLSYLPLPFTSCSHLPSHAIPCHGKKSEEKKEEIKRRERERREEGPHCNRKEEEEGRDLPALPSTPLHCLPACLHKKIITLEREERKERNAWERERSTIERREGREPREIIVKKEKREENEMSKMKKACLACLRLPEEK